MSEKERKVPLKHPELRYNLNQQIAREIKGITSGEISADNPLEQSVNNDSYLPERNALGAIIISNAFTAGERFRQQGMRGKYGLLDVTFDKLKVQSSEVVETLPQVSGKRYSFFNTGYKKSVEGLIEQIGDLIGGTMRYDIRRECDRMAGLPEDEYDRKIYDRLAQLTHGYALRSRDLHEDTAFQFAQRNGTGIIVLQRIAHLLYDLHKKQNFWPPSTQELAVLVRNSYPTILRFASGNLSIHMPAMNWLSYSNEGRFNEKDFTLVNSVHGKRLLLPTWQERVDVEWKKHEQWSASTITTTGCPAIGSTDVMQDENAGFKNVVHGMVNWFADILETT